MKTHFPSNIYWIQELQVILLIRFRFNMNFDDFDLFLHAIKNKESTDHGWLHAN